MLVAKSWTTACLSPLAWEGARLDASRVENLTSLKTMLDRVMRHISRIHLAWQQVSWLQYDNVPLTLAWDWGCWSEGADVIKWHHFSVNPRTRYSVALSLGAVPPTIAFQLSGLVQHAIVSVGWCTAQNPFDLARVMTGKRLKDGRALFVWQIFLAQADQPFYVYGRSRGSSRGRPWVRTEDAHICFLPAGTRQGLQVQLLREHQRLTVHCNDLFVAAYDTSEQCDPVWDAISGAGPRFFAVVEQCNFDIVPMPVDVVPMHVDIPPGKSCFPGPSCCWRLRF